MSRPLKPNHRQQRHGLYAVERMTRKDRWLDELGPVGEALRQWQRELIDDLGGPDAVSAQQRALVELATKTHLMLESIDAFLLEQPSLVNRSRRQLWPVVRERQTLADSMLRYMTALGLKRQRRELPALTEYLRRGSSESPGACVESPPDGASAGGGGCEESEGSEESPLRRDGDLEDGGGS